LFLVLKRGHRGKGFELAVKGGWTELRNRGKVTDANWFREVGAKEVNRLKDAMFVIMAQSHSDNLAAVRARKQPVTYLAHNPWRENRNSARRIEQTD
jgi:hypothetical protein